MCLDSRVSGFSLFVFAQLLVAGGSCLWQNLGSLQPLFLWVLLQPPPLSCLPHANDTSVRSFVTKAIHGISLPSNSLEQKCPHVWYYIKIHILAENQGNMIFPCLLSQHFPSLITELYYFLSPLAKDCQSPNTDSWAIWAHSTGASECLLLPRFPLAPGGTRMALVCQCGAPPCRIIWKTFYQVILNYPKSAIGIFPR